MLSRYRRLYRQTPLSSRILRRIQAWKSSAETTRSWLFQPDKIAVALTKAFVAVEGDPGKGSSRIRTTVSELTATVVDALTRRLPAGGTVHIEDIQDQVELALMRAGEHDVARAYVLYRQKTGGTA